MVKGRKGTKVKDKWRIKKWVIVKAPSTFGANPIGYVPITDESKALKRVVQTTLFDILHDDPQQYSIKLYFQIESISGDIAQTILKGHEYSREYLRSMVRRGSSSVRLIKTYLTKDQALVSVQIVVFTQGRINTSRKHAIRSLIDEVLTKRSAELSYSQFAQEAVLGKLSSDIYTPAKKISHIRHIGISKTKLLRKPTIEVDEDVIPLGSVMHKDDEQLDVSEGQEMVMEEVYAPSAESS